MARVNESGNKHENKHEYKHENVHARTDDLPLFRMARTTDRRTAKAAAERLRAGQRLSETQARVLAALAQAGARGLTDAELAALPAFRDCRESTARKRRCELYAAGHVVPAGVRDRQTVWVAARTAASGEAA